MKQMLSTELIIGNIIALVAMFLGVFFCQSPTKCIAALYRFDCVRITGGCGWFHETENATLFKWNVLKNSNSVIDDFVYLHMFHYIFDEFVLVLFSEKRMKFVNKFNLYVLVSPTNVSVDYKC